MYMDPSELMVMYMEQQCQQKREEGQELLCNSHIQQQNQQPTKPQAKPQTTAKAMFAERVPKAKVQTAL